MQVAKEQIERQQLIFKALGFYNAAIDGVWGPETIEAKKKFEASRLFAPGIPNNGMPFITGQQLPAGMSLRRGKIALLYHPLIEALLSATPEQKVAPVALVQTQDETTAVPDKDAERNAIEAALVEKDEKAKASKK